MKFLSAKGSSTDAIDDDNGMAKQSGSASMKRLANAIVSGGGSSAGEDRSWVDLQGTNCGEGCRELLG